jgi:hypothetical protein
VTRIDAELPGSGVAPGDPSLYRAPDADPVPAAGAHHDHSHADHTHADHTHADHGPAHRHDH